MLVKVFDIEKLQEILKYSNRYSKRELENLLNKPFVDLFLFKTSSGTVGFSVLWKFYPEVELHWIEIFEPFRGKSLGKNFLEKLLKFYQSEGFEKLLLEVSEKNVPALRLYKKFSPKVVGRRKAYYPNGSDALLLEIPLKGCKSS